MRLKGFSILVTYDPVNFCWTVPLSKNYYGKEMNRPGVVSDRLKTTRDKKRALVHLMPCQPPFELSHFEGVYISETGCHSGAERKGRDSGQLMIRG